MRYRRIRLQLIRTQQQSWHGQAVPTSRVSNSPRRRHPSTETSRRRCSISNNSSSNSNSNSSHPHHRRQQAHRGRGRRARSTMTRVRKQTRQQGWQRRTRSRERATSVASKRSEPARDSMRLGRKTDSECSYDATSRPSQSSSHADDASSTT